ncbi:MAG TPA: arylamine N-acetyltransferase [Rhizomicrobium sp.]
MNIEDYLARIGLEERPAPDLEGLRALHRAHLLAIPYENLDVQLGRPVTIERPPIFDKLVRRRRGGWCYEMNGLLGWSLGELGFRVARATGAVMREAADEVMAGNHLVLKVELDEGLYLADVGFGDGPIEPIRVAEGAFSDGRFDFALSKADGAWWRFHNHPAGGAKSFDFHLAPADESLFAEKCAFLQTSQASPFVQNLVCQRHTNDGLSILRGRVLKSITPNGTTERLVENAGELIAVLGDVFALDVPEAATLWPKICARHEALFAAAG